MQIFPGFVHIFGCLGHHLWILMGQKIVGKLIQNMFLGPFIFCSIISPRPTHIYKI